jgi:hypothetical protein
VRCTEEIVEGAMSQGELLQLRWIRSICELYGEYVSDIV